jgi:hypothetical protein
MVLSEIRRNMMSGRQKKDLSGLFNRGACHDGKTVTTICIHGPFMLVAAGVVICLLKGRG